MLITLKFFSTGEDINNSSSSNSDQLHTSRTSKRQSSLYDRGSTVVATNNNEVGSTESDPDALSVDREAIIEKIQDAATSYDPRELSVIRPHLVSDDPEIRDAAVNAMIVLGDASAGPMLREAAKKVSSAEESKKMVAAADYVELPSASFKEMSDQMKKSRARENDMTNQSE